MKNNYESYKITKFLKVAFPVLYFVLLIYILFFARRRRYAYKHEINLVPFKNILPGSISALGLGSWNYYSNLLGNIVIFIPFSLILSVVFKAYRFSTIILISFGLSFLIELLQYIFKVGVADIDDIILNTTGACVGYFIYSIFKNFFN
jgi:glycopeptide antibiotics resistance protein